MLLICADLALMMGRGGTGRRAAEVRLCKDSPLARGLARGGRAAGDELTRCF